MGSSIFDSVSFLLKFMFFIQQKRIDSLTPKRHNSSQNENDSKAVYSFAPTPPIFKLKQEV